MKMILNDQPLSKSGRPTISACMIAKNEEKFLAQCLRSIEAAVDEIILVDTGSTDTTVEIARSFGAKVYHHPWRDNFSEARNHSLRYATGEWILYIDADEELVHEDIPLFHRLICTNSYNAIYVAIYSEIPDGKSKHYYTRILRREKVHFEGLVHEQPIFDGNALRSEIRLNHYGYNLSADKMQEKYVKTEILLKQELNEKPDNIFTLANLVRTYRNKKDNEMVIEWGEKGLSIPVSKTDIPSQNQRQRISLDLAHALLNTNRLDRAEEISTEALKTYPDFLDNLFQLGNILVRKKDYHEALRYYKRFLFTKEKEHSRKSFNQLIVDTYNYEHKAYNNIGECYKQLGLINNAEVAYKKALELYDKESLYYTNLAELYISQNRLDDAEDIVNTAIKQGVVDTWIYWLLGKIYEAQSEIDNAVGAFKQSVQEDNKNIPAFISLINLLIRSDRLIEAEEILKIVLFHFPDHIGLKCLMEKVVYKRGNSDRVEKFICNVLKSNPSDNNVFMSLADLCVEIENFTMAIEILERYLKIFPNDAKVIANIATCYARLGKLESAILGFQTALTLDPNCSIALKNLSVLKKNCNA